MPNWNKRLSVLDPQQVAGARLSVESNDTMGDQLWVVDEAYQVPSRKDTQKHLRINTYSKAELHDRYMSSEEEPSPSPDSDTESDTDELKHKILEKTVGATTEPVTAVEYEAKVAIAIPIFAMRPKLIDITNLAPMHKRKRTEKPVLSRSVVNNAALRMPAITDATKLSVAPEATKVPTPKEGRSTRKDSRLPLSPSSWLPDDGNHVMQEEEEGEEEEQDEQDDKRYFPDLDIRKAPTYDDYDPYSLSPPHLSPRNSYHTTNKKPGSVARARNNSNPPITMNSSWKGLTRSMSLAKRQALRRPDHPVSKRSKMVPRPANEREEPLKIPAFPFGDGRDVD